MTRRLTKPIDPEELFFAAALAEQPALLGRLFLNYVELGFEDLRPPMGDIRSKEFPEALRALGYRIVSNVMPILVQARSLSYGFDQIVHQYNAQNIDGDSAGARVYSLSLRVLDVLRGIPRWGNDRDEGECPVLFRSAGWRRHGGDLFMFRQLPSMFDRGDSMANMMRHQYAFGRLLYDPLDRVVYRHGGGSGEITIDSSKYDVFNYGQRN